jgi:predicted Co/Zn/Cd cation transporter (cation efflux family)
LEDSHNCVAGAVLVNGLDPFASKKVVVEGLNDCVARFAFMDALRRDELASKGKAINVIAKTVVGVATWEGCNAMAVHGERRDGNSAQVVASLEL